MPGPRSVRSNHHGAVAGQAPPSPTLSAATTNASVLGNELRPPHLITRADIRNSIASYEALLAATKSYTSAMLAMSHASSGLASALEGCSRVKGAHEAGAGLQAASGLHHLLSNYQSVLADVLWRDFTIPLLEHFDSYRLACADRQAAHERAIQERSKVLRETEERNRKEGKKRTRDLGSFRRALAELQAQVDELDRIKSAYYHEVLDSEEDVWGFIEAKVAHLVRSQVDIYERISSKGSSDPILESMLSTIPDPFSQYGPPKTDEQIFSILPPGSLGLVSPGTALGLGAGLGVSPGAFGADAEAETNGIHGADAVGASSSGGGAIPQGLMSPTIMSPRTPSTGLPRNAQGGSAAGASKKSGAAPASKAAPAAAIDEQEEEESTTAIKSLTASGSDGLFGDTSQDLFAASLGGSGTASPTPTGTAGKGEDVRARDPSLAAAANRLKHALSIIDESGPKGATPASSAIGEGEGDGEERDGGDEGRDEDGDEEHGTQTPGQDDTEAAAESDKSMEAR